MELADDDTLGSVDDECPGLRHERNLAHVNALFLGRALVLVPEGDVKRGAVGLAVDLALNGAKLGLLQRVADEIQGGFLFEAEDREELAEDGLQADILALRGIDARLEELLVRLDLKFDEVRGRDGLLEFAEVDAFRHGAGSWVALGGYSPAGLAPGGRGRGHVLRGEEGKPKGKRAASIPIPCGTAAGGGNWYLTRCRVTGMQG